MDWYDQTFVQTGRSPALWALVGFLVTFALVRTITRRIHARQAAQAAAPGPVKDVYIGGVHVHHQVWGILLVLVSGLLVFRFTPASPWIDLLALGFGAGAALTLDEFALWFHLDDVYWSTEGRKSIDAILVGAALGGAILLGVSPIGQTRTEGTPAWIYTGVVLTHMACAARLHPQGQALHRHPGHRRAAGRLGRRDPAGQAGVLVGAPAVPRPEAGARRAPVRRRLRRPARPLRDLLGGTPVEGPAGSPRADG